MSGTRVRVLFIALAACAVATSAIAYGSFSRAPSTSLRISYEPRPLHLTFYLRCDPPSGTLRSPAQACRQIARTPAMLFPPPEGVRGRIRSCPAPRDRISIDGLYTRRPVSADFASGCDSHAQIEGLWLRYLPPPGPVQVEVDRALGPVHLGESANLVRSVFGPPHERVHGADVYKLLEEIGVGAQPVVPEIFVVGYGRMGRVTTLIYNGDPLIADESVSLPPQRASATSGWPQVRCGGREARVDHLAGRTRTIVWPPITVIVTSEPSRACEVAAATAPQPVS